MKQSPHKYLKDGHIHTPYCPHGTDDSFEEYVQKAIQVGVDEISFTEHFPLPEGFEDPAPAKDSSIELDKMESYINDVKKIKEKFQSSRQITIGSLRLDLSDGHAYLNNSDTGLTRTEFSLLRLLAENQEKVFSAKELYEAVWGSCAGTDTSTVRRHIFNLRTKIGAEDTDEYDIVSVYGKGYLFTCR